jgi:D-alanyl-D-alanine carboxypeptidase/D-alanyl-D-alanine-endopeptidase (penicillin-binding protein 4)
LEGALAHPGFRGATVGVLVVRSADGQVLFERGADRPLAPASNLKVLTALAALQTFGPAYRFTTRLTADRTPDADGAVGALAVRGAGDPALTSEEWWRVAADLRRRGLRRVRGELILDDTYFDQQRWLPSWGGISARAFHAAVGALAANYGSFAVEITPERRIAIDPPVPYFELVDRTGSGATHALTVDRDSTGDRDRVTVAGKLPAAGSSTTVFRSASDPARYAAAVLRMQLAAQGIIVDGPDRVAPVPAGFSELLAFEGKPLADIVRLLMKYSNNNIAEMLVKAIGAHDAGPPGSWPNGLAAMQRQLASLGVDLRGLVLVDGSGLSPDDRVTPRALVGALRAANASFAFGPEYLAALPLAARDGTLSKRAAGAIDRVRAKTGLINGVAALSGFARLHDGTDVAFSILVNGYTRGDAEAMAANDVFAEALVQ